MGGRFKTILLLLAALSMSPVVHSQAMENVFVPEKVFAGRSQGKGHLRLPGRTRALTVQSLGVVQADGRFRLQQDVKFEGRPAQSRVWLMWQTAPGKYAATLTGAAGPVVGGIQGNRLTLRYPLTRWGLVMHQTLDLNRDGRSVENYGDIRFMGMRVGWLRETIQLQQ